MAVKVCLAGEGAMGLNHAQALQNLDAEVVTLACGVAADGAAFAREWDIAHHSTDLATCLGQPGVEAVILTTPNQLHARQAMLAMEMGKHVLVEIPMGLTLEESRLVAQKERETGLVCMVCHSLRYSSPQREVVRRVRSGELHLHHIIQQTFFMRRENTNMFGKPRSWTDELLWHQACHMVDFMFWLFDDPDLETWAQAGPRHARLGIPMDIDIGMRSRSGCLISSALSFNHAGPISSTYRFIGEEATLRIEQGKLIDHEGVEQAFGEGAPVGAGWEVQDGEFLSAIKEGRAPATSCVACLPVMELLDRLQRSINDKDSGR